MIAMRGALALAGALLLVQAGCGPATAEDSEPPPPENPPGEFDVVEAQTALVASSGFTTLTASTYRAGNPPASAADGSLSTFWSAYGNGVYIVGDMGSVQSVSALSIAWYRGAYRKANFAIQVGTTTSSYKTVYSGTSSGRTSALERYAFTALSARYVKVIVNGNTENKWASIPELRVESTVATPAPVSVTISPATATVQGGSTQQYTATAVNGAGSGVTWSVQEGASGGGVSAAGLYSAPATAGTYHVVARAVADSSKSATATVAVTAPAPVVAVTVSPRTASVAPYATVSLSAAVTGTSNTTVAWSVQEGAAGGSVSAAGVYTAPATQGTYHVIARSGADSAKSDTATITVAAAGQTVAVSVSPSTASVAAGGTAAFTATVTGTASTGVTWSVQEGSAGGSVTAAGVYTAPSAAGTYHVVATSNADGTKRGVATVTVTAATAPGRWVTAAGAACTNGPTTSCEYASCKGEAMRTQGTIFYACDCQSGAAAGCAAGNDANTGRSPSAPWRTFGKLRGQFGSLAAGDTVAFCRGGSFTSDGGTWTSYNATAANPVIIRDYTAPWNTGAEPRPRVAGALNIGGNGSNAAGYRILNIRAAGGDNFGVFARYITDATMCNIELDGFSVGVYNSGPGETGVRNKLIGSRILNGGSQGWLGSGSGCEIVNSYFNNNATSRAMFDHSIYLGGTSLSSNEVVSGNEIHAPSGINGTVVVIHGQHQNLTVENNVIDVLGTAGAGGWGISTRSGYSTPEFIRNATFRGNRVTNAGNLGMSVDMCQQCVVENNVVVNTQQGTTGIAVPGAAYGQSPTTNVTVRNNTVYLAAGGTGISTQGEGTGYVVSNNAIQTNAGATCYSVGGGAFAARDYNLCWGGSGDSPGSHSLHVNPQFASPQTDLRPASGSPLIGASDPARTPAIDAAGKARPVPGAMGAYEP